jgi:hypothetical protein
MKAEMGKGEISGDYLVGTDMPGKRDNKIKMRYIWSLNSWCVKYGLFRWLTEKELELILAKIKQLNREDNLMQGPSGRALKNEARK